MLFKSFKIKKSAKPVKYSTPINNIIKVDDPNFKAKNEIKIFSKNIEEYQKPLLILEPTVNNISDEDIIIRRYNNWKQFNQSMNGTSMFKKQNKK